MLDRVGHGARENLEARRIEGPPWIEQACETAHGA
jgi:hypothetical protein